MASRDRSGPRPERLGVLDEAVASLGQRRTRTALTALGTVLGVGVLVAVLGLTATATSQIDARFTALSATEVTIAQVPDGVQTRSMAFPDDFETRVERIDGVEEAGLAWTVSPEVAGVRTMSAPQPGGGRPIQAEVVAASVGALNVAHASPRLGRLFDAYAEREAARVVVIGPTVAATTGLASLDGRPALLIGGLPFTVVGVLDDVERHPELLNAVVVPAATARSTWGDPVGGSPPAGWVEVAQGAGPVVAKQLAVATSPAAPERFEVVPPPDPRALRGTINADLQGLFLVLAGVCLIIGMVGIANTTFVTVMERLGEIGLRRALGARRRHIAAQFLAEAAVIGLIGGLAGALLGLGVVVAVALVQQWTAVVPPLLVIAGPLIGAATAVVAAVYPAWRGASTEPVQALRAGAP